MDTKTLIEELTYELKTQNANLTFIRKIQEIVSTYKTKTPHNFIELLEDNKELQELNKNYNPSYHGLDLFGGLYECEITDNQKIKETKEILDRMENYTNGKMDGFEDVLLMIK